MSRIGIVVLKQFILRAAEACSQGGLVCEEILGVRRRADKQGLLLVYCNSTSQPGYRFGKFPVRNFSSTPSSSWEEVEEIQSGVTSGDSAERSSEQQIELLWKNFFSDPAQWWDRRSDKSDADEPDFRHKNTLEGLWIQNRWTPSWVAAKLFRLPEHLELEKKITSHPQPGTLHVKRVESRSDGAGGLAPERSSDSSLPEYVEVEEYVEAESGAKQAGKQTRAFYSRLIQGCCTTGNLKVAKQVHTQIINAGHDTDRDLGGALVDMYVRCNSLIDAHKAFDNIPQRKEASWTGLITAYVNSGKGRDALALYEQMLDARVTPSSYTFTSILKACGNLKDLDYGRQIHNEVSRRGLETDSFVGPAIVGMYARGGSLLEARELFNNSPQGNVAFWNAMIGGYADNGYGKEALLLFEGLKRSGLGPTTHTYVHALRACSSVGALDEGNQIHADIRQNGWHLDPSVGGALVEMYAQWGQMDKAKRAFDELPRQTVGAWNKLIRAYGQNDNPNSALQCFSDMQQRGVRPDGQTFSALLVTCSHQGLVHEGKYFFKVMQEEHGISPTLHHYTCMADVLGRSGHLHEAAELLDTMPFEPTVVGWTSLLSACSRYGDVDLGRRCFEHIVRMQPNNASGYLLMSRLYSSVGLKEEAASIERLRRSVGARNYPASVLIQVNSQIHEFLSGKGSKSHPMFKALQDKVKSVTENMKRQGFDVGDSRAYSAPLGPPAEITEADERAVMEFNKSMGPIVGRSRRSQNRLRMCASCHQWVKVLSLTEKRQVIMRDGYRTHHFKDGQCSCRDRDYGNVLVMSHRTCSMNSTSGYSYSYSAQ